MNDKNMTALVSCFSRAYHYINNEYRIFKDSCARKILSDEEYESISQNMKNGIKFFNHDFVGTEDEALRWIVNNQLSPSVLGRSAFAEKELINAIENSCKQYLIFASGYDTFALRNVSILNDIAVFEIDREEMIEDKKMRVEKIVPDLNVKYVSCDFIQKNWINNIINSGYIKENVCFCSLLGISYYLSKEEFEEMIKQISNNIFAGSYIVFDYPTFEESNEAAINEQLAKGANEEMKSKYSYNEIVDVLENNSCEIVKNINDEQMTAEFFGEYNRYNRENVMKAPRGVSYCLAVKKEI